VLGLRQYNKERTNSTVNISTRSTRHSAYIKDMLVAKFLARHQVQYNGSSVKDGKDISIRLQMLVTKEFEKFMDTNKFDQKHLDSFERELKAKMLKAFADNPNISIKEVVGKPLTTRYQTEL